jgi:hypothetical protein
LRSVFIFGADMVFDPKEALDNPYTHQERPSAPLLISETAIVATPTGNAVLLSQKLGAYVAPTNG